MCGIGVVYSEEEEREEKRGQAVGVYFAVCIIIVGIFLHASWLPAPLRYGGGKREEWIKMTY